MQPLSIRGARHPIPTFCLIQCHPFIHAAPDLSFIHSVLSRAIVHTCGTRHVIHSFCLSQWHSFIHVAPDMPSIHSFIASAISLYTRHLTCHPFILSLPVPSLYTRGTRHAIYSFCLIQCHLFIHAAPDMPSIHSVLASAIPAHQTCHPFIHSYSPRNAIYVPDMSFHMRTAPDMSSVRTGTGRPSIHYSNFHT